MALTDFRVCRKTKRPQCCDFWCCGNKFGVIERYSQYTRARKVNHMKLTRRYAKHVEKQIVKREIALEME